MIGNESKEEVHGLLAQRCPLCGGELSRTQRRPIDLLVNAFVPRIRVRCGNIYCQYEGNLRRLGTPAR